MDEKQLLPFLLILLLVLLTGFAFKKLCSRYGIVADRSKYPLKDLLKWAFRDKETRKRIFFTLVVLVPLQFAFLMPLPGVHLDLGALDFFSQGPASAVQSVTSQLSKILTLFSQGIAPFLLSCLIIQLGSLFIPPFRRWSFGGEEGRRRIVFSSYLLTFVLTASQAYYMARLMEGAGLATLSGWTFRLLIVASLTGAVMLLLLAATAIQRSGIGNGFAMIVISTLPVSFFYGFKNLWEAHNQGVLAIGSLVIYLLAFILLARLIFWMTTRSRPVTAKTPTSQGFSFSFRPTWVATRPLAWAMSFALFPSTIHYLAGGRLTGNQALGHLASFVSTGWAHFVFVAVLTLLFVFIYGVIVFKPSQVAGLLKRYGYSLSTDDPARLRKISNQVLTTTFLFLLVLFFVPICLGHFFGIPSSATRLLGLSGLILLVGVASDLVRQLEFLREKVESGTKNWVIGYTAFDEIEAAIKSQVLKDHGIVNLVEPLRFTWGMPVRTAVDQYRLYVPAGKKDEARQILL